MKILLFGATGMLGRGVLRECLLDPGVDAVVTVGRAATGVRDPKLREILHPDLFQFQSIESELAGFDACFFCLGVSAGAVSADDYERLTFGIATAAAATLARLNPAMTFIYVSGAGTDSSEKGRVRWARVKGRTENAILAMPFRAAYMFRPGLVQAMHGERSRTTAYRVLYDVAAAVVPLLRRLFPAYVLTTEEFGRAMLAVARRGAPQSVLESRDIAAIVRPPK